MSILRVEQDGVEFFTLTETGESGMSISGLARLCGVSETSIRSFLKRNEVRTLEAKKRLEVFQAKDFQFEPSWWKTIRIVSSDICGRVIEHYAYESKQKRTAEALYAYRKFAQMGINAWIQDITGWQIPQSIPLEPTLENVTKYIEDHIIPGRTASAVDAEGVIEIIQKAQFSATGLRLFLYLEMKMLLEEQPGMAIICDDLNISPLTVKKWLPKIQAWSNVACWLKFSGRKGPERLIQERLHRELGGDMEVATPIGPIDLVTPTEIIEIKRIEEWKTAFGQVISKSQTFPKHNKRIHLFGESSKQLKKITTHCHPFEVTVTFEAVIPLTSNSPLSSAA
jgi:hypothetical protein